MFADWSLDTETTGIDMKHGARPFFVTMCNGEKTEYWEWPVDPLTREVQIDQKDLAEIRNRIKLVHNWSKFDEEVRERHTIVLQNAKFDVKALATIGINNWPWSMTRDTLVAAHLLHSNSPHDLTKLALRYLKTNIKPLEDALERCVKKCRSFIRSKKNGLSDWRIAKKGRIDMPSAKDKTWKFDSWAPKALAVRLGLPEPNDDCEHEFGDDFLCEYCGGHQYHTCLRDYSNADSSVTHALWQVMWYRICKKKLQKIFYSSMQLSPILCSMEQRGIVVNANNLQKLQTEYQDKSDELGNDCVDLADSIGYELTLPKGGVNDSLRAVMFDGFGVEKIKGAKSKTDAPSLDKHIMEHYTLTLPQRSKACIFVKKLLAKRSLDTALTFMRGYKRFAIPLRDNGSVIPNFYRLFPSLNQTGTHTTRLSSQNPNEQNISKKKNFNLRYCFGPAPGREMWRLDYENLELRIPAYDCKEPDLIALFEDYDKPPYYGSEHILNFSVIYEDIWKRYLDKYGPEKAAEFIKSELKSTWYGWCKNGDFALQYNCGEATADKAFHKEGCYKKLKQRFNKKEALNQRMIDMATRLGYIETMPDRTVDPERGYPLYCTQTGWGKILPTTPLSYRVQGTAGWVARKAMIRCEMQLAAWRADGFDGYMDVQVHDELGFDFPVGGKENLWRINRLKELMEMSGDDIGVPLKVDVSYHPNNWSEEIKFA